MLPVKDICFRYSINNLIKKKKIQVLFSLSFCTEELKNAN